jgi:uncharacterized protein YjgD (DUF1641 family)
MNEKNIQDQINEINFKLDRVLEFVEHQHGKREEFDDLVEDLSIVAKDAFSSTVTALDKAGVELDTSGLESLLIKLIRNAGTFNEMLDLLESARDFVSDVTPVLHQVGLDTIEKFNEFERKGYIDFVKQLVITGERFMQTFTANDLKQLESNIGNISGILRNITRPEIMSSLNNATKALAEVRMDDRIDDKSFWQLFQQMRSPEVRKSLSYSLRLLQAIYRSNN